MAHPIPDGINARAIREAAARLAAGEPHSFGERTTYEALIDGARYAPKALIGVAAMHELGLALRPADFRGGERPGEANWYLRKLGFDVVSKEVMVGADWTDDEIWVAIDVYFEMLLKMLEGERYIKASFMRTLARRTHGRSAKSAEYKLQNVSAVLLDMGLTRLKGFAPATNYQTRLGELVDEYLSVTPAVLASLNCMLDEVPDSHTGSAPQRFVIEESPPDEEKPRSVRRFRPKKVVDRAGRDAANRRLGRAGEAFIVAMEREGLLREGRADLAEKVRWVANDDGDGAGYDVLSFENTGEEIFIEVKTTNSAKETPFFITSNEMEFSALHADKYRLYRLFNFALEPRLFVLKGFLHDVVALEPVLFRAQPLCVHRSKVG